LHYVSTGEININALISNEKILLIEPVVKTFSGESIIPIKEKLGHEITFGEIKLVLAWINYQKSTTHINH